MQCNYITRRNTYTWDYGGVFELECNCVAEEGLFEGQGQANPRKSRFPPLKCFVEAISSIKTPL